MYRSETWHADVCVMQSRAASLKPETTYHSFTQAAEAAHASKHLHASSPCACKQVAFNAAHVLLSAFLTIAHTVVAQETPTTECKPQTYMPASFLFESTTGSQIASTNQHVLLGLVVTFIPLVMFPGNVMSR
jgi:hypothetical protein